MKTDHKQIKEVRTILNELLALLDRGEGEDWSQGIRAACQQLVCCGIVLLKLFSRTRDRFMIVMGGGYDFAEYNIWMGDEESAFSGVKRSTLFGKEFGKYSILYLLRTIQKGK